MPRHNAPPPSEDLRMVEALRARRPGAAGHVYSVYGPELVEYAEILLGDRDRAVDAVRSALLTLRDRNDAVPDAGTFRDWLYGLVREQCHASRGRGRRRLATTGVATGAALTAGMLVLFDATYGQDMPVTAPPMALSTPTTPTPRPTPTVEPTPSPSPSETPSPEEKRRPEPAPKPTKATKPEKKRHKPATVRGRLAVDDEDCQAFHVFALPDTCYVRLTAKGGPVKWSVASVRSVNGRIGAGGSGTLASGRSTSVAVRVRPTILCHLGGRVSGTVSFAPGGTATVIYTCLGL